MDSPPRSLTISLPAPHIHTCTAFPLQRTNWHTVHTFLTDAIDKLFYSLMQVEHLSIFIEYNNYIIQ